jgi:hypothetical protein
LKNGTGKGNFNFNSFELPGWACPRWRGAGLRAQ